MTTNFSHVGLKILVNRPLATVDPETYSSIMKEIHIVFDFE